MIKPAPIWESLVDRMQHVTPLWTLWLQNLVEFLKDPINATIAPKETAYVAGEVGYTLSSSIATGSQVALTTNTPANIAFIDLTEGTWTLSGVGWLDGAAATALFSGYFSFSTTSNTMNTTVGYQADVVGFGFSIFGNGDDVSITLPTVTVYVASTTRYYLVANAIFATSTCAAYGYIQAVQN